MEGYSEQHNFEGVYGTLTALPGNSEVVISHGVWLPTKLQGQGRGSRAHERRLAKMRELGFALAICTVANDNVVEKRILEKNGWRAVSHFRAYGGRKIVLYTKNLARP